MLERVAIVCRRNLEKHQPIFRRLVDYLEKKNKTVFLESRVATILEEKKYSSFVPGKTHVDLIIVMGGDGTILRIVSKLKSFEPKIIGINMGHLGFLSEIPPIHIHQTLNKIFSGKCTVDKRMQLEATLHRDKELIGSFRALNEVVISQGTLCRLISLKTKVDGRKLANYKADGLMVGTPTGSTAYNLSAGGPIVHPSLDAMILTPICPHSFNQKPIVLPDHKKIEIKIDSDYEAMNMTMDGQTSVPVKEGDLIKIKKGPQVSFLRLPTESYFMNLRHKLGWGERVEKVY